MVFRNVFTPYALTNRTNRTNRFDQPHGQETAKYGSSWPFWPRTALSTWRNPGPRPTSEIARFPSARGPETGKKFTTLSVMVVHNFLTFLCFDRLDPQGRETAKYGYFRLFWRNSGRKTEKRKQPHCNQKERNKPLSARSSYPVLIGGGVGGKSHRSPCSRPQPQRRPPLGPQQGHPYRLPVHFPGAKGRGAHYMW